MPTGTSRAVWNLVTPTQDDLRGHGLWPKRADADLVLRPHGRGEALLRPGAREKTVGRGGGPMGWRRWRIFPNGLGFWRFLRRSVLLNRLVFLQCFVRWFRSHFGSKRPQGEVRSPRAMYLEFFLVLAFAVGFLSGCLVTRVAFRFVWLVPTRVCIGPRAFDTLHWD